MRSVLRSVSEIQMTPNATFQRVLRPLLMAMVCGWAAAGALGATLSGTLNDPQGRVVTGATVRLLRRADGSRRETKTNNQGQFSIAALDIGEYQLSAEAPGGWAGGRPIGCAEPLAVC